MLQVLDGCSDPSKPVPINTKAPIQLDSALFQGTISIQVKCVAVLLGWQGCEGRGSITTSWQQRRCCQQQ